MRMAAIRKPFRQVELQLLGRVEPVAATTAVHRLVTTPSGSPPQSASWKIN